MDTKDDVREWTRPNARSLRNPPVIVMNMYSSGLGIARDLADSGVRVIGFSAERGVCGNYTRTAEIRITPNSQTDPEKMVDYLMSVAGELNGAVIFPTRDADVV